MVRLIFVSLPTRSHLQSTYIPLPWNHCSQQWQHQGPSLPLRFSPLTLIFCPSRGRGLAVSCLSARQFYLSITKPSAVLQWPRPCINPLSASQPSITPLSITSDPSSAHLSLTAHARRWSPRRAPLASDRGWTKQLGIRKLEGKAERRLYPTLPLSFSVCIFLKSFPSCHYMLINCCVCFLVICLFSSPDNSSQWEKSEKRER